MFQKMASGARRATGINTLLRDILAGEIFYQRSSQADDAAGRLNRMTLARTTRHSRRATLPTLGPKPEGRDQDQQNLERNQCNS